MRTLSTRSRTFEWARIRKLWQVLESPSVAWVILVASLLLTFCAWLISKRVAEQRLADRFNFRVARVVSAVEERLLEYEQVLRGGTSLFYASEEVSRKEWATYVSNCEIEKYFPGIQGMGVSIPVHPAEKANHEKLIREEGFHDYKIKPDFARQFYTSIVYLEPFDWRNQRAFGYDMYSNETRREAMDRAIETGEPAMSGLVTLVQETESDVQNGWLFYLPMYKGKVSVEELGDVDDKRSKLARFVYAAFRAEDLMNGVLQSEFGDLNFEVYDSNEVDRERLLYDSNDLIHLDGNDSAKFTTCIKTVIRGRQWCWHFESSPEFIAGSESHHSTWVALGGLLVDFLLFAVIASIGQQKRRSVKLAKLMTRELREREELISAILSNASEAIITVTETGEIKTANPAAVKLFGIEEGTTTVVADLLVNRTWESIVEAGLDRVLRQDNFAKVRDSSGEEKTCQFSVTTFVAAKERLYIVVAQDETERIQAEKRLAKTNAELIAASRKAAKVEFANGVLHNVGNVVNSINVSTGLIKNQLEHSAVDKLDRICQLIDEHESDFGEFVENDQRGKSIPRYLSKIRDALCREKAEVHSEFSDLVRSVRHVKEIILSQQSAAKSDETATAYCPWGVFEDAVAANKAAIRETNVQILMELGEDLPETNSDKHKILQVLINLIKNAIESLKESGQAMPELSLQIEQKGNHVQYKVGDNGLGISADNLNRMFSHGFTTKDSGHGFGLHSCANVAEELGGSLTVTSEGLGKGATFTLSIPLIYQDSPENEDINPEVEETGARQ